MAFFFLIACGIYGLGAVMKVPKAQRWSVIGVLLLAVVGDAFHLSRRPRIAHAFGGDGSLMLARRLCGFDLCIPHIFHRLRARVATRADRQGTTKKGTFSATELDRYARHIVLREIGGPGQKKLKNAKVLVIGAGGLGAPVLQYLAAAGVGTIGVIDDDICRKREPPASDHPS